MITFLAISISPIRMGGSALGRLKNRHKEPAFVTVAILWLIRVHLCTVDLRSRSQEHDGMRSNGSRQSSTHLSLAHGRGVVVCLYEAAHATLHICGVHTRTTLGYFCLASHHDPWIVCQAFVGPLQYNFHFLRARCWERRLRQ